MPDDNPIPDDSQTVADPKLRNMPPDGVGFSVAFSFSGEQRELVRSIAQACENRLGAGTVFFDEWFPHILGGFTADMFLQKIYGERTQMIVLCVSKPYGEKPWTMTEHDAIMSRVMTLRASQEPRDRYRFLPIRVGDGDVPGVLPNAITLDAREPSRGPTVMAEIITRRLAEIDQALVPPAAPKGTVLVLPCMATLTPLCTSLLVWLENMDIAVLRPDPLLHASERAIFAAGALLQANVIVEWFQQSDLPEDRPFLECHEEIRARNAGLPAQQRKPSLMWLSPGGTTDNALLADTIGKRMLFEQFKKTVHEAATSPRQAANRVVIAAARADAAAVRQFVAALAADRPRDSQYDDLHLPPDFKSAPDVDARIQKAIRKPTSSLVLIDGRCSAAWIEDRLRAYDLFRESAARAPKLIVWDVPQLAPKPPREFWPDAPDALCIASPNPADVAANV
jgi:hypothetical protein